MEKFFIYVRNLQTDAGPNSTEKRILILYFTVFSYKYVLVQTTVLKFMTSE